MSQYHQGPYFPVSSSPILPLDAHPTRPGRPSPLSLDLRLSLPNLNGSSKHGVLAFQEGQQLPELSPPGSTRSAPADWIGEVPIFELDVSKAQHKRGSQPSTGASSPYIPPRSLPSAPAGWQAAPAALNLVPYKPFPENLAGNGTSFFYRSPTPSARQRTNQACEKCRDRKTKCSGGRPTCVRCQARGLICEYASETRVRGPSKSQKRNVPSGEGAVAAPAIRRTIGHHVYAPRMPINRGAWGSQSLPAEAPEGVLRIDQMTNWTTSDHSDQSNGPLAYASAPYPGLNGMQGSGFTPGIPLRGYNDMHHSHYRPQTAQHNGIPKESPILRVSASMPQLRPVSLEHNGGEEDLERSSSSVYSGTSLDTSFAEFLSSSEESFHSGCPSSSSSPGSNSHSSPDEQDILATGVSSTTIKFNSWPANATQENEQKTHTDESENPVYHKEGISPGDIDGDTPKPSSQQFNASEWIHEGDFSQSSSDYRFPAPATPES